MQCSETDAGGAASSWRNVLALDASRKVLSGSQEELRAAIRNGADLRVYSEFRHNEHIDTKSDNDELVRESMDMRATYLVDDRWCAGILTLRQPVALPDGFGPRPSLSLFLYNEDGQQAIARPFLDDRSAAEPCPKAAGLAMQMPKYHQHDHYDADTNAPCTNFIYDFDVLRFFVRDDWTEVLHHTAAGDILSRAVDDLAAALSGGAEIKVGVQGLCAALAAGSDESLGHEVFIQCGSCYYYTRRKLFIAASHPVVRVRPRIPLRYVSGGWDYSWLLPRTDGRVAQLFYDPYTLEHARSSSQLELRWFVR